MAGKTVFENKGKGKKKKNKPKSNIFGKENKRRINQKKEIFAKVFHYTFVYHISFYKSTFLKNKKRDLLLNYRSQTSFGVFEIK